MNRPPRSCLNALPDIIRIPFGHLERPSRAIIRRSVSFRLTPTLMTGKKWQKQLNTHSQKTIPTIRPPFSNPWTTRRGQRGGAGAARGAERFRATFAVEYGSPGRSSNQHQQLLNEAKEMLEEVLDGAATGPACLGPGGITAGLAIGTAVHQNRYLDVSITRRYVNRSRCNKFHGNFSLWLAQILGDLLKHADRRVAV